MTRSKNNHALNLFISYDLKKSIQDAATECDCSLADLVRFLLRLGLPIVRGICESRELLLSDQVQLFRDRQKGRVPTESARCRSRSSGGDCDGG